MRLQGRSRESRGNLGRLRDLIMFQSFSRGVKTLQWTSKEASGGFEAFQAVWKALLGVWCIQIFLRLKNVCTTIRQRNSLNQKPKLYSYTKAVLQFLVSRQVVSASKVYVVRRTILIKVVCHFGKTIYAFAFPFLLCNRVRAWRLREMCANFLGP